MDRPATARRSCLDTSLSSSCKSARRLKQGITTATFQGRPPPPPPPPATPLLPVPAPVAAEPFIEPLVCAILAAPLAFVSASRPTMAGLPAAADFVASFIRGQYSP